MLNMNKKTRTCFILACVYVSSFTSAHAAPLCKQEQKAVTRAAIEVARAQRISERLQLTFIRRQEAGRLKLQQLQTAIDRARAISSQTNVVAVGSSVNCVLFRRRCGGTIINGAQRSSRSRLGAQQAQANYDRYANILGAQLSRISTRIAENNLKIEAAQAAHAQATQALNTCTAAAAPQPAPTNAGAAS